MTRKPTPFLRDVNFFSENLQAPLYGHEAPREGEDSGVYYLAVGVDAEDMKAHLKSQLASPLWLRRWICDPENPYAIKLVVFPYRSVAEGAMAIYAALGVPSVEVSVEDLPLLLEDCNQMLVAEADRLVLWLLGIRLGPIQQSLGQHRDDEITKCLQDPQSAREACWLLNARDKLYGRNVVAKVGELPWSVRVTEWEILPARAVHKDGNAVYFEGEWRFMPLTNFWRRYGNPQWTPYRDLPREWRFDLARANLPKPQRVEFNDDDDDDCTFISDPDDVDESFANSM
ncbi:hypothetical protein [Bradyrhizobium genosp. P]|uniref:hypothetical protein n=1 Tax=Bradyrhizobium genosp. P TaxID=83641 RepID=UPI003CF81659